METLVQVASNTIASPDGKAVLVNNNGRTKDIIAEIMHVEKLPQLKTDTKKFAHHLRAASIEDTLYNIWSFVRHKIRYITDDEGKQFIKTPSRVWADGYADCKGKSIFISSLLHNLGFKNFGYRFTSYTDRPVFTHVYIYVIYDGKEYILDSVMPDFNTEKPFKFKKDIPMTQIYRLSGISEQNRNNTASRKLVNLGMKTPDQMTEAEMELWIARDRMKTEQAIMKSRGRDLKAEKYQDTIDMLEDAIEVVQKHDAAGGISGSTDVIDELMDIADDAVSGVYSIASSISGIGRARKKAVRRQKKAERKKARTTRKPERKGSRKSSGTRTGNFLRKIGQKAARGARAITRVATAPARLAVKGLLEITLPKAAPFFLYLFITDKAMIERLPPRAREKRKKSEKLARFIIKTIGMKEKHFMGIVRNGIMKRYSKSPETVIAEQMRGISGIGALAAAGVAFAAVKRIIEVLGRVFGKRFKLDLTKDDFPDPASQKERNKDVASNVEEHANNIIDKSAEESGEDYEEEKDTKSGGPRRFWNTF